MLAPGSLVGTLRIVAEVGRGGMGVVYRAHDPVLGDVAVKTVSTELSWDPQVMERFAREARLATRVVHPNVARLHRIERTQGLTLLVLELVPGGSLADHLHERGPLPWREAFRLGAAVARGLAAIHEAGIIHRDVKPGNILLAADGTPKVGDFGLARRTTASGTSIALTRQGDVVGTLEYIAPEQTDGSEVGPRSDVYALGATIHELVAGHPPFEGHGFEVVKKHMLETPPSLRALVPGVPAAASELVQRLLAKTPAARGDAATVALELEALAGIAPTKERRRAPMLVGVLLVALAAAGTTAAVALRVPPAPPIAPPASPSPQPPRPPETRPAEDRERATATTGWADEALPPHVRRGREKPVLVLAARGLELELVYVPPGAFVFGDKKKALLPRGIFFGRTEVTWHSYRAFCKARNRAEPPLPTFAGAWLKPEDADRHPVVNVTWEDAGAFCKWIGGRLPKEVEWERAARGTDGRLYPWGDTFDGKKANTNDASCPPDYVYYDGKEVGERRDASVDDGQPFTAPVGSFPEGASAEGALDLCGNVWEWCQDAYDGGKYHGIRGGSWELPWKNCRSDYGGWRWSPLSEAIGFRVVLDGPP